MKILLALLVACGAPVVAPIAQHAPPSAAPSHPAPTIALDEHMRFTALGLPAISADGSVVAIAHVEGDARGEDITLWLRDREDRLIAKQVIGRVAEDETPTPELTAAFASGNKWLAEKNDRYRLAPMMALEKREPALVGDGISIDWDTKQLSISRGGAAPFVHSTPSAWLAKDAPMYKGSSDMCHNEAFLRSASVDLPHNVAVIVIAYLGTDTCWEPSSQEHVVHW